MSESEKDGEVLWSGLNLTGAPRRLVKHPDAPRAVWEWQGESNKWYLDDQRSEPMSSADEMLLARELAARTTALAAAEQRITEMETEHESLGSMLFQIRVVKRDGEVVSQMRSHDGGSKWNDIIGQTDAMLRMMTAEKRCEELEGELAAERHDLAMICHEVSIVYDSITGGVLSKPNTAATAVIQFTEEHFQRYADDDMKDAREAWEVERGELEARNGRLREASIALDAAIAAYAKWHDEWKAGRGDAATEVRLRTELGAAERALIQAAREAVKERADG